MEVEEQEGPTKGWTWADAPKPADNVGKIGPAYPGTAIGISDTRDKVGNIAPIGPSARAALTSPLFRPTGNDTIDGFTSPLSLALMAVSGAPAAVKALSGATEALEAKLGSGLAARIIKFATPGFVKKPAEAASLINEILKSGTTATESAPAAVAKAPVESSPVQSSAPPAGSPSQAAGPVQPQAATATPKMALNASDVAQIQKLKASGIAEGEAVRRVWNAKMLASSLGTPSDTAMAAQIAARR